MYCMHSHHFAVQMRSTIKAVFPDRDVATLVRPALSEAHLQRLDTLPGSSLRPEFQKVRQTLLRSVDMVDLVCLQLLSYEP
jgi:hypothetical protein